MDSMTGGRDPRESRPGTRTFLAMTAEYEIWRLSRVGLDLDDAIDEEMGDYRRARDEAAARGEDADAFAARQDDRAIWEGPRLMAAIRPRVGGEPEVTRYDGVDDMRPLPEPSTEDERWVWGLVKEYGASKCRQAIVEKFMPGPEVSPPAPLTPSERTILDLVRTIGVKDALDRLLIEGVYGFVQEVRDRLGTDAFAQLRRLAREAEGRESSG